jgi:hypothetical protein
VRDDAKHLTGELESGHSRVFYTGVVALLIVLAALILRAAL